MSRFAFCIIALLAASSASAASIKWTGYAKNGQWSSADNWDGDAVPGPNDDVTINQAGNGNVTITTPVTVSSISMGNDVGQFPFLIVDSSLLIENTFTVNANGGLVMSSGASMVTGTVVMGGNLIFTSGTASGSWTIASPGKATLGGAAQKAFSGCTFNIGIDVDMSGLITLNQSSVVSSTATVTASGAFSIQAGDSTAVSFDTSKGTLTYNGGGVFQVMAPWMVGTFNFVSGNLTLFDSVTFGAAFSVPMGSTLKSLGMAQIAMPAGVSGSGYMHIEGASFSVGGANFSGSVNAQAGTFESSSASSISTLAVTGSTLLVNHAMSVGMISLTAGQVQGNSTLTISAGSLESAGFNINATVVIMGSFKATGSVIALGTMGGITIASGATFTTVSAVTFSGPPATLGVTNHGMINAQGMLSLTNIDLKGTGSVTVSDELQVGTITMTQAVVALTGNGKFIGATTEISSIGMITGTPGVTGSIGAYMFSCDKACKAVSTVGIPTSNFIFSVMKA